MNNYVGGGYLHGGLANLLEQVAGTCAGADARDEIRNRAARSVRELLLCGGLGGAQAEGERRGFYTHRSIKRIEIIIKNP